jgi:hypothetical protein
VTEQPRDEDPEGSERSVMEANVEPINEKGKSAGR